MNRLLVQYGFSNQITTLNTGIKWVAQSDGEMEITSHEANYLEWHLNEVMSKDSTLSKLTTNIITIEDNTQLCVFAKILLYFGDNKQRLRIYNGKAIIIKWDRFDWIHTNAFGNQHLVNHHVLKYGSVTATYSIHDAIIELGEFNFNDLMICQAVYNVLDWFARINECEEELLHSRSVKLIVQVQ